METQAMLTGVVQILEVRPTSLDQFLDENAQQEDQIV